MPRKSIYSEPLTGAEAQERYRQKHQPNTIETLDRKRDKARKELHDLIDDFSERELYAFKPVFLFLHQASQALTDKAIEKLGSELQEADIFGYLDDVGNSLAGEPAKRGAEHE